MRRTAIAVVDTLAAAATTRQRALGGAAFDRAFLQHECAFQAHMLGAQDLETRLGS